MVNIAGVDNRPDNARRSVLLFEADQPADLRVYRDYFGTRLTPAQLALAGTLDEALQLAPGATGLIAKAPTVVPQLLAAMPRLDWIQALTTGVDNLLALSLPGSITLCSARGIHGPQMSELGILLMLSLARDFPRQLRNQQQSCWQRWPQRLLQGKSVAIVGIGSISTELAKRCGAFGMRVIGVSNALASAEYFDEVLPRSQLHAAAGRADYLVLLVPYAPETHHLVDDGVLQAMKPGSYLLNLARGRVVDELALIAALQAGTLVGAALDVFWQEPLPAASPLWSMPNVIITPHVGGLSDCYAEQLLPLLEHNLRAYLAGDAAQLRNVVAPNTLGR